MHPVLGLGSLVAVVLVSALAVTNAVVLLAPMGCGSMAPLGKLF
jgi:hypothetical protein